MGYKNKTILQGTDRTFLRPRASYTDTIKGYMTLQTSARPVFNAGIGAEVVINPGVNLLFGTRTDFNNRAEYLPGNEALHILSIKSPAWHYIYFSTGVTYKLTLHNLTAGFDYGIGIPTGSQQIFNITDPKQELFLRGNLNQNMKTSVHKLNFILSYVYFFKKKEKKTGMFSMIDELKTEKKKKKTKK